jgi:hypothetical protein
MFKIIWHAGVPDIRSVCPEGNQPRRIAMVPEDIKQRVLAEIDKEPLGVTFLTLFTRIRLDRKWHLRKVLLQLRNDGLITSTRYGFQRCLKSEPEPKKEKGPPTSVQMRTAFPIPMSRLMAGR